VFARVSKQRVAEEERREERGEKREERGGKRLPANAAERGSTAIHYTRKCVCISVFVLIRLTAVSIQHGEAAR